MPLIDFDATLNTATQAVLGSDAVLMPDESPGGYALSAIDKTAGIVVGDAGDVGVQTVKPAAVIRASDLAALGVTPAELDSAMLALNGKTWRIEAHRMQPGPGGEASGEILLLLSEA